ncbi:MAG: adenosylcobinamide-phosphate synthase CbiB [Thermoplasmata archaeon]|jgi:adenosylcobinamide-phosphate synthase|nr:cobalamin biosynthesis protein CobD [Thermoplasmatales archaeon]
MEIAVLLIAIAVDAIGEYPEVIHPVVWVGKVIEFYDVRRKRRSPLIEFIEGLLLFIFVSILFLIPILFLLNLTRNYILAYAIVQVFFLKSSFSIGSLIRHVKRCEVDDLNELRKNVSMIVSRDVSKLDRPHLYSAAIESGAENIVDSIVSPLFYFLILGVPGAFFYRIVNTFDAMVGYRNERYEYFGKFAARMDDIMNFIPARITGLLLLLFSPRRVWERLKRYRRLKINGMYTIASISGILDVTLEKIGYYRIEGRYECGKEHVAKTIKYIVMVSIIWISFILVVMFLYGLPWWC